MPSLDSALVQHYIASTRRTSGGIRPYILVCLVLFAALIGIEISGAKVPDPIDNTLPWALLAFLLTGGAIVNRRRKRISSAVGRAWDHLQLENFEASWETVLPILEGPIDSVSQRGQVLVILAVLAEYSDRPHVAIEIYQSLLIERAGDPLLLQQAQIALAKQMLHAEQLSDAVQLIDRLMRLPMPPVLAALLDLVHLQRQVFMGQAADAVESLPLRREAFRKHLSTRAGYAYALFAAALNQIGRAAEAAKCWADATLLIEPDKLLREYALLEPVARSFPATERPA